MVNTSIKNDQDSMTRRGSVRKPENTPVIRGMRILALIAGRRRGWTISELSREMKVSKSTVSHLLQVMVACDYVRQNNRYYALGSNFLDLVKLSTVETGLQMDLREAARPYLQRIVDKTGLGANLGILDHTTAVYIDRIEPPEPLTPGLVKIEIRAGLRIAPHVTAIGKALICHLDEDIVREIWENNPIKHHASPKTIRNFEDLKSQLAETRGRGYAIDLGEHDPNVRCVAAPVFGADGRVVAAISVNGTPERLKDRKREQVKNVILREAKELSEHLKDLPKTTRS